MLVLLQVEGEALSPLSQGVSVLVGLLALVMAVLAWRAALKRNNRGLRLVSLAFGVFALKNAFSAYNVRTHAVPHDAIELVLSLFDLVLLLLLFAPLFWRKKP